MMREKILLVEDQPDFQMMIQTLFQSQHDLSIASNAAEALRKTEQENFDLILLDISLPDTDGLTLFQKFKSNPNLTHTPILFLTSKSTMADRVAGLSLGADDYIIKPFEPEEFMARVASKLIARRAKMGNQNYLQKGQFRLDGFRMKAFAVGPSGEIDLDLTPTQFRLLHALLKNEGRVLSREQLTEELWNKNIHLQDRTVDRHISSLRKKVEPYQASISSVRFQGYKLSLSETAAPQSQAS
ncbi:MAG: response regulator transcription factor [Bdellovibrionales bacterium]|nr:response regulator transcription factor [Bdellovibrionales bacterium]